MLESAIERVVNAKLQPYKTEIQALKVRNDFFVAREAARDTALESLKKTVATNQAQMIAVQSAHSIQIGQILASKTVVEPEKADGPVLRRRGIESTPESESDAVQAAPVVANASSSRPAVSRGLKRGRGGDPVFEPYLKDGWSTSSSTLSVHESPDRTAAAVPEATGVRKSTRQRRQPKSREAFSHPK